MTVGDLRSRFVAPPVQCVAGQGGLPCMRVQTDLADATIYLHGAHVTHFQPRGQKPILFLSKSSWFADGKPIRGGVPICFPWFGPRRDGQPGAGHGFVRLQQWEVTHVAIEGDGTIDIAMQLLPTELSRSLWPFDFALEHRIRVGRQLEMALTVSNRGQTPFAFEEALHTYFMIGDIHRTTVTGLSGATYLDQLDPAALKTQDASPIAFTAETDRVYLNTPTTCLIHDQALGRQIHISKTGSGTTVVWNPWINKSKAMVDFGDDEWPGMLCIETANAKANAVTLGPGASHVMAAIISATAV